MQQAADTPLALQLTQARSKLWPAAALFCAFLLLFLLLPSQHYAAVDGAMRCLEVLHSPTLSLHGNNHVLYPFWVFLWSKLAAAIGIHATSPFEFIRVTEAMNSVLAAASIALLFTLINLFTDLEIATLCTLLFGCSTALLLHASNSAEPVAGLFFAVLGISLLATGLRREKGALLVAAGLSFAVGLASYQAMATIAGAGAFLVIWWAASVRGGGDILRFALVRLGLVCLGGVVGICGIFIFAYAYQGIPLSQMPRQFFSVGGSPEVYGGFTLRKLVNLPFVLLANLYSGLPLDYVGVRSLFSNLQRPAWISAVLAGLLLVSCIGLLAGKGLRNLLRGSHAAVATTAVLAAALLIFPLLDWQPEYDKLWLLPLAALASTLAASFHPGALLARQRKVLAGLLLGVLVLEIGMNIPRLVRNRFNPTPHLADAEVVRGLVRPHDWVVVNFDDVSGLWLAFWGYDAKYLLLPASTAAQAAKWLNAAKQDCMHTDGRILFLGVMDEDRKAWDSFLGPQVRIPFSLLDEYRSAVILRSFGNGSLTLRAYRP
jgi:hypothetical protein